MKSRKRKRWILLSCLVYGVGISVLLIVYLKQPADYFSSPTESRDLSGYKDDSSIGILEKKSWSIDDLPPVSMPMATPTLIPGEDDHLVLNWEEETAGVEVPQTENWTRSGLLGDDAIEFVAFATWTPQPDDEVSDNADWETSLVFHDAKTLELIPDSKLDDMKIPASFRSIKPLKPYRTPKIRLLFKVSNMEVFRIVDGNGGDTRTGACITYDLESLSDNEKASEKIDHWARYDMALLAWHDTPVRFHLQVLTGEPEWVDLKQEMGQQVAFGDLQRIQWVTTVDGDLSREYGDLEDFIPAPGVEKAVVEKLFTGPATEEETADDEDESSSETEGSILPPLELPELGNMSDPEAAPGPVPSTPVEIDPYSGFSSGYEPARPEVPTALWLTISKDEEDEEDIVATTLVRIASENYMKHLGWKREDGSIEWSWYSEYEEAGIDLYSTTQMKDLSKPLPLVLLPKTAEITFDISGMPGLPNSRNAEDLFDVVIPRITLPEDPESAEDRLLQLISVVTQNGWDIENLWDDNAPPELPSDRTFRNKTPQELLDWYLKVTPTSYVQYDEAEHVLTINEEKLGVLERIKNWIDEKRGVYVP